MKFNRNWIVILILFLAVFVSYINVFQNNFVWDDEFFIVNNIDIKSISNIPGFFTEPSPGNLYRPLRTTFYTITYQIWGLNPLGYHLNGFFLHFFITILLFFITLRITNKPGFSFVVALFFAVHPIHTARVTNMTASFDLYGILFLLLSLFFYILNSKNKKNNYYYLSIVFYLLALFSSEETITLILILFLYDFSFNYKINIPNFKLLLKKYIPYFTVTAFYLFLRFFIVGQIGREQAYFHASFYGTFLTTLKIYINYIALLFFPVNLTIEHSTKFETSILSFSVIAPLLILAAIFFIFIKSYKKSKLMFFSLGWFFITLLPFSNFAPQVSIMAERYLYLSSFGFILLFAFLIFKIEKINSIKKYNKIILVSIVILLLVAYSFLTIQRNSEWKGGFTLYLSDLEKNPIGTHLNQGLALEYKKIKDYDKAIFYAKEAIRFGSKNYRAYETLATSHAETKDYKSAIEFYEAAIELNPDDYLVYNNLGLVYSYMGDLNKSISHLKKAIEIDPKLSKAHNDLGTIYAQLGMFDEAIKEMEISIKINPYNADYYYNLAVIYEFLKDNNKARELLEKGIGIEPGNKKIKKKLNNLKS